ncbi:hypothetical protein [Sphaerisporangium fuscum]|uniref:hypothetical protein n=1 Tax=Sphaerisporangium fuscum TaxID=2835868 RepID=UPI001BDBCD96|nr:hypothetical protein [Sphaerisporangium fuscum]
MSDPETPPPYGPSEAAVRPGVAVAGVEPVNELLIRGMPEERAESHRRALRDLRVALEGYGLRCRPVERLLLSMDGGHRPPMLLPPEMDVYDGWSLVAGVIVVDVPGGAGPWLVTKERGGLPVRAYPAGEVEVAARDLWQGHGLGRITPE